MSAASPNRLFHYTPEPALHLIVRSEVLLASTRATNPRDVRYGNGQYLSDIPPGTMSLAQLSRALVGHPFAGRRYTHFIEIDIDGVGVILCRPGVFLVPNNGPLDLRGRIFRTGEST